MTCGFFRCAFFGCLRISTLKYGYRTKAESRGIRIPNPVERLAGQGRKSIPMGLSTESPHASSEAAAA
jgi:hypothetical protein